MREYYSQKDPRWKNVKLGTCTDTIGQSGCKITSYANFVDGKTPAEVNDILKKQGGYTSGYLTNDAVDAPLLGFKFIKRTTTPPSVKCICETDHYKSKGVPQHFFLWKPDGTIIDPLDYPTYWKPNPYRIVSYRVFEKIDTQGFEKQEDGKITTGPKQEIDAGEEAEPQVVSNDPKDENSSETSNSAQCEALGKQLAQCDEDLEGCKIQLMSMSSYKNPEELTLSELCNLLIKKIWRS